VGLLSLATAAATYLHGALSVLSTYLVEEFGVTRSQLGLAFTVVALIGGIAAPFVGKLVDVSTRRVMAGLFAASTFGVLLAATAPDYVWVLAAALLGGLGLAAGNPVTNKLVSEEFPATRHGVVIGIKQAGPPMGLLAAGLVLPPLAVVLGWRWALALTALMPLLGFVMTWALLPAGMARPVAGLGIPAETRRTGQDTVWWLTVIGFPVAAGTGAVIAFVPLYAHEELGVSVSVAGLLAAVIGISGVAGRVLWGAHASRFGRPTVPLTLIAVLALFSTLAIWGARGATGLIWVGAVGVGFSMLAWHAVAWLTLIDAVDLSDVGRTTGVVQLGNSAGFATGPLIMGVLVDARGSYGWGWGFITGLFMITLGLTIAWRRTLQ